MGSRFLNFCLISVTILGCSAPSAFAQSKLDFWEIDSILFRMEASIPVTREMMKEYEPTSGDHLFLKAITLRNVPDSTKYFLEKAGAAYLREGDTAASHLAEAHRAKALWHQSKYDEALQILGDELEYAVRNGHRYLQFYTLINICKTHYQLNNFARAYQYLEEAGNTASPENSAAQTQILYLELVVMQGLVMHRQGEPGPGDHGWSHSHCVALAEEVILMLEQSRYYCLMSKAIVLRTFSLYVGELATEDSIIPAFDSALQIALDNGCQEPFEFALANKMRYFGRLGKSPEDLSEMLQMLHSKPEDQSHMAWAYSIIAGVYAGAGDYQKAYAASEESRRYYLKVYNQSHSEALAEQAIKFETFKKDLENEKLTSELAFAAVQRKRLWWFFSVVMLLATAGGALYWAYYRNKVKHREQQIMASRLLEGEQKERMRLARDLHDSVGQLLSALKLQVGSLSLDLQQKDKTENLLNKTIEEVRSISHNLLPKALDQFGLVHALEDLADQYTATGSVRVEVNVVGGKKLPQTSKHRQLMILRIVQENLQNIVKHSKAEEIAINIFNRREELRIDVTYLGTRVNVEQLAAGKGIGWKNITARIKLLNGEISFDREGEESVIRMRVKMAA